jgi:aryl carrier-like protein
LQATLAFLTPSFIKLVKPEDVPTLKTLVLAGEPASQRDIQLWIDKVHLIIGYGQTESAVCCSTYELPNAETNARTIGQGSGAICWVVDEENHERLCPIGTIGELIVEGPGLARGYLHDEAKTATVFVENPRFLDCTEGKRRLYATGDLVRQQYDGYLVYVGRRDMQIKRNGQRIELGEIEHHVQAALPEAEAVVVETVVLKESQQLNLVAFLCLVGTLEDTSHKPGASDKASSWFSKSTTAGLRTKLSAAMPEYMIPSFFIPVQKLPVINGAKVDRAKLRKMALDMSPELLAGCSLEAVETKRPPGTSTERRLQRFWADVLNVSPEDIGIDESFHGLGGDSLAAMRLVSLARAAGLSLSVADLFGKPSLTDLATFIDSQHSKAQATVFRCPPKFSSLHTGDFEELVQDVVAVQTDSAVDDIEDVVEATDTQASMVAAGVGQHHGQTGYFSFDFEGLLDRTRLKNACQRVVAHFSILRTAFIAHRKRVYQVVLKTVHVDMVFQDSVDDVGQAAKKWMQEGKKRDRVLGEQLVRFCFFRQDSRRSRLIMEVSHAQYDGMSYPLLAEALQSAYLGRELPERPQMYELVYYMQSIGEHEAETYWQKLLQDATVSTVMPASGSIKRHILDRVITKTTKCRPVTSQGFTFATVLKAAWASVLAGVNGTDDVVFGQLVSGRSLDFPDISQVLGACINTTPVRVKFEASTGVELLRQVQQQHLDSIPFEILGTKRLIKQCTKWGPRARLSTVVHHLSIGELEAECQFGEARCKITCTGLPDDSADIVVASVARGEDVDISLGFSEELIPAAYAEELLRMLGSHVEHMLSRPEEPVSLYGVEMPTHREAPTSRIRACDMSTEGHPIVNSAWDFVMGQGGFEKNTPYWEFWDDDVAAAQLATFYCRQGVSTTVEEVMERPTMLLQSEMMMEKIGEN